MFNIFSIIAITLTILSFCLLIQSDAHSAQHWRLNTSNSDKLREFQQLFAAHDVELTATRFDLDEIDADPMTVIAHKASQLEEMVLIEDTSLDIEDANVGVNVRWLIDHLDAYIGRTAIWTVLLAYRSGDEIFVFKGEVKGKIVPASGTKGFGFDPIFLPDGAEKTLAESKPNQYNARALVVDALLKGEVFEIGKAIYDWDGPWQNDNEK